MNKITTSKKVYHKELDGYAGIAILFVIFIHANAYYLSALNLRSYISDGIGLYLLDNIIHIAVPIFIFIAGFKFQLNNNINDFQDYKNYFFKKLKLIKPFFIFTLAILFSYNIYVCLGLIKSNLSINVISLLESFSLEFIKTFIGKSPAYHLWFIPMYLFVTLAYPLWANWIKNSKIRLTLFAFISLVCLIFDQLFHFSFYINYFYYFLIFEMGVLFCKKHKQLNYSFIISVITIYVIALIATILVNNKYYLLIGKQLLIFSGVFTYYYLSYWLKNNNLLSTIGKYSFYIYILHDPVILKVTFKTFQKIIYFHNNYAAIPLVAATTVIISIFVYQICCKTFLNKVLS